VTLDAVSLDDSASGPVFLLQGVQLVAILVCGRCLITVLRQHCAKALSIRLIIRISEGF
jgi:hypothetical protein